MYARFAFALFYLIAFSSSNILESDYHTKTGYFWHITDIHVDQNYSRTGNPRNLCHEEKGIYTDNGLYGNFLCDSPQYLVNVTFQAMNEIKSKPDFIIWTGDNLPHTVTFDPDWKIIFESLHNITFLTNMHFSGVPVFPCIGNHDTFPPNILLPNEATISVYQDILHKGGWDKFLNEEAMATFIKGGFYSQIVKAGLRIISLNTILWYTPNTFTEKMLDPADQFKWFEEVLENCTKLSEKVYIIGHVPPGFYNRVKYGQESDPTYHPQYLYRYLKILKKYTKIVLGQMFGHLHIDMFQLFELGSGSFMSSSLLASSVTPWHFESKDNISIPVNPSIRLLHYDRKSGVLKDYDQFFLNLTKANSRNNTEANSNLYERLYTFTETYDVPDLSTESLSTVFNKIKSNDALFNTFFKFSTAGKESVVCDEFCKVAQLCAISCTSIDEYNACMSSSHDAQFTCHNSYFDNVNYSNYLAYGIAIFISLISLFLLFFICRQRTSKSDTYTKLQRDF